MGCPNARAGGKMVKKIPLEQPKLWPPSLITTSGISVGAALAVPILVGKTRSQKNKYVNKHHPHSYCSPQLGDGNYLLDFCISRHLIVRIPWRQAQEEEEEEEASDCVDPRVPWGCWRRRYSIRDKERSPPFFVGRWCHGDEEPPSAHPPVRKRAAAGRQHWRSKKKTQETDKANWR